MEAGLINNGYIGYRGYRHVYLILVVRCTSGQVTLDCNCNRYVQQVHGTKLAIFP